MHPIIEQLEVQHQKCEHIFCQFEDLVANDRWDDAKKKWDDFETIINEHFLCEETKVFSIIEEHLKHVSETSPSEIFRIEHEHLLNLIKKLKLLLIKREKSSILEYSDFLMSSIIEHAQREENNLFPEFSNLPL